MKLRNLAVTLTIAFISLSTTVMLINCSINIYSNFLSNEKVVFKEQQIIASNAANEVKSFIQEKIVMLSSIASVNNVSKSEEETQKLVLGNILGLDSAFRQIALTDKDNNEVRRFSRLSKSSLGQLNDKNKKEAFSQLSSDETYISKVYVDEITFEPIIIIAVPIIDKLGDKDGVIFAELNLKFMWDLIDSMKIGENGLAYVVDSGGSLIAFGDVGRVIKGENLIGLKEVSSFIQNKDNAVDEVSLAKGILGTNVLTSHVSLGKPDWAVIIEVPLLEAAQPIITNITVSIIVMIISFILAVIIGLIISRRITRPIIDLKNAADLISKGELDTHININSKNEIGELASVFNKMVSNINKLITNIKQSSRTILEESSTLKDRSNQSALSSQTIVSAMGQISKGADEQAREAEKTSEQTNVLGEEINCAVAKALEVEKITESTKDLSIKSKDAVEMLIDRAKDTDRITRMYIENTKKLNGSFDNIRGITEAIFNITNKTKMLALNARIEAARAGEAGQGFTVIVNEISNLANQSREAAKMIEPILKDIEVQSEVSTKTSEQANEIVEEQMKAVFSTQSAFDEIISSMDNAIYHISELSDIIRKINVFKDRTVSSVMTISSITQETAASCEEVSSASEEQKEISDQVKEFAENLYSMGEKLVEIIEIFKTKAN